MDDLISVRATWGTNCPDNLTKQRGGEAPWSIGRHYPSHVGECFDKRGERATTGRKRWRWRQKWQRGASQPGGMVTTPSNEQKDHVLAPNMTLSLCVCVCVSIKHFKNTPFNNKLLQLERYKVQFEVWEQTETSSFRRRLIYEQQLEENHAKCKWCERRRVTWPGSAIPSALVYVPPAAPLLLLAAVNSTSRSVYSQIIRQYTCHIHWFHCRSQQSDTARSCRFRLLFELSLLSQKQSLVQRH